MSSTPLKPARLPYIRIGIETLPDQEIRALLWAVDLALKVGRRKYRPELEEIEALLELESRLLSLPKPG